MRQEMWNWFAGPVFSVGWYNIVFNPSCGFGTPYDEEI